MTRKFLFCFPLRVGNIVFGYIYIMLAVAVILYNLYYLAETVLIQDETSPQERFRNWENLEQLFGQDKSFLVLVVTLVYYLSYLVIGFLMLLFGSMFVCGIHKVNYCLVSTFFVYCFFHLFLTIALIVWEATSGGTVQLGIIIGFDLVLIVCLFGVKYLMEAILSGHMYSRPGEVPYKF